MIGLGTWEAPINTMVFKGTGRVTISDADGKYDFRFQIIGEENIPEIKVSNIRENGSTLTADSECELLKGHKIPVSVTFLEDTFTGFIKVPLIGKIKLSGKRVK